MLTVIKMAYSKLHSSIVNSSLWVERDATRLLFITLLAMCDKDGMVYGSRGGLARVANIKPDDAAAAWDSLMSPDQDSSDKHRAPENEGRRVEEVSGGFKLLNFAYYRGLRNEDDRREQNRAAQAKFKAKDSVSQDKPSKATVSLVKPRKAHTDTDTEAERKDMPPSGAVLFEEFWKAWPKSERKGGKAECLKLWKASLEKEAPAILAHVAAMANSRDWQKEGGQYIPAPAVYLRQRRWDGAEALETDSLMAGAI